MTLYKQITLSIILLLFASFLGTVIISTENLRTFLLTQLASHAQDTATSLGLSLSPPMQIRDITVITAMIDAVFDRGDYQQINITALNGDTLLSRTNPAENKNIPDWFTQLVDLQPPTAEALIMSGWQQAGIIQVTSHPGNAYSELWSNTVDTSRLFLALAVVIVVIALIAVNFLLRPLRLVESQADAICNASYMLQTKLPRTRELRRVVTAMNRMSEKIGNIFAEQSTLTEKLREQSYKDPVTGLGNRRFFDRQLQTLMESHEESSTGALLLLELHALSGTNLSAGYTAGDQLLQRTADIINNRINHLDNCFAARISGAGYGIVAVGLDQDGNLMTAGLFMPMAERFGLASDFDKLAVSKLLTHMESTHDTKAMYAFNLSTGSLQNPVFIQWLCSRLERAPESAKRILVEFPEYGALINIQDTRNLIERLGSLGCQCGIDHFGRGFSSFGYLRNIKVSYLKVDSSYTRNIDREEDNQFLMRALTETAHSVDIAVIAQAVETSAERDTLTCIHLDGIQGFLTGRPQPLPA